MVTDGASFLVFCGQALLVLHQPEIIELWNPDAPIETFWDIRYDEQRGLLLCSDCCSE